MIEEIKHKTKVIFSNSESLEKNIRDWFEKTENSWIKIESISQVYHNHDRNIITTIIYR